ncbi:hypothetical protein D9758_013239 [Tetrapyrgos nigripes]|uniref:Uncharacterized protein n=1 Tax=Tetrapyrgos nigripes TaxID=182062 RepID=A0A8H5CMC0_9AGAR|nr:hypothetical protein D9758_013239 [Tetrapyrgos nigripes]
MQPLTHTRSTSIHKAISQALSASEPKSITVAHILPIYIRFAGFDKLCHDALVAFEHAMEKGRVVGSSITPPDATDGDDIHQAYPDLVKGMLNTWQLEAAVIKLREEYWKKKLGGGQGGEGTSVCTCEECGRMRLVKPTEREYYDEGGSRYVVMKAKDLKLVSGEGGANGSATTIGPNANSRTKRKVKKAKKTKMKKKKFVQGVTVPSYEALHAFTNFQVHRAINTLPSPS